jgi:hypothetical protein
MIINGFKPVVPLSSCVVGFDKFRFIRIRDLYVSLEDTVKIVMFGHNCDPTRLADPDPESH